MTCPWAALWTKPSGWCRPSSTPTSMEKCALLAGSLAVTPLFLMCRRARSSSPSRTDSAQPPPVLFVPVPSELCRLAFTLICCRSLLNYGQVFRTAKFNCHFPSTSYRRNSLTSVS
uniref:Uncharacterized protein n=1 Tax=Anguilla anguilla TaxID=7936 RepID=A0A0E9X8E2_ANGAN